MMRPLLTALLTVSLAACGGSNDAGTNPPPPPLPPITRLVLEDTSALVFTGSSVPGQAFVAHAYDATGAEVAHPVLTLTAGSGWTVRGDTLVAPSAEGRTILRISARRAAPTTADWIHLDGTVTDSAVTDSMAITAGIDLGASHWSVSYICRLQPGMHPMGPPGLYLDSVRAEGLAVDTVLYAGDGGWYPQWGGVAQVKYAGTITRWMSNDSSDMYALIDRTLSVNAEVPDTLYWGGYQNPAPRIQDAPRQYVIAGDYVARTLCNEGAAYGADSLWFDEAP